MKMKLLLGFPVRIFNKNLEIQQTLNVFTDIAYTFSRIELTDLILLTLILH